MKRTGRGFMTYTEFKDYYGENVAVRRSSLVGPRCVWIFPEAKMHLGQPQAGAHLTVAMAKRVIKALQKFVDGIE